MHTEAAVRAAAAALPGSMGVVRSLDEHEWLPALRLFLDQIDEVRQNFTRQLAT